MVYKLFMSWVLGRTTSPEWIGSCFGHGSCECLPKGPGGMFHLAPTAQILLTEFVHHLLISGVLFISPSMLSLSHGLGCECMRVVSGYSAM